MADSRRPPIPNVAKRTHIRQVNHFAASPPPEFSGPPRVLDGIIVGLGYASLTTYLFANQKRLMPWELASLSLGSLVLGFGLFDLGLRSGIPQGASLLLRRGKEKRERLLKDEDDWKEEFRGRDFATLNKVQQVAWLRKEERRILELQAQERAECGRAYIEKEEAYRAYEKKGGYGGETWKMYSAADDLCKEIYNKWERRQRRLTQIRKEINALEEQI
ncbi:uncharacterized protein L3040_000811 [Drepanopeziza brunnea f. sp. 'multigermtubi']|uniref:uncharacterized protein n=1 Tax=Drepanopeziza brunnea f. sp. 'multigermtubi' TaxID=698441 RepID=UPI00238BCD37|nr:hypothetical protein L3040_000811 [Drepanopeziza brunnea f. sp. 'multigermtubi']